MNAIKSIQARFADEARAALADPKMRSEEGASKTAAPVGLVGSDAVVRVPDMPELPRAVRQRVKALSQDEWMEEDWMDLHRAQKLIEHNLAARHGLLEQPNVEISHDRNVKRP